MSQGNNTNDSNVFSLDNSTDHFDENSTSFDVQAVIDCVIGLNCVFLTFGTFINVWFIAAILTSSDMRMSMRNKVLVNLALAHLLDCLLTSPVTVALFGLEWEYSVHCVLNALYASVCMTQECISNWNIVILLVVFIGNICDFNPTQGCTPKNTTKIAIGVLALPWIGTFVAVPSILVSYFNKYSDSYLAEKTCSYIVPQSNIVFFSLDMFVPLSFAFILVAIACVCRRLRFWRAVRGGAIRSELIGGGREIDSPLFYVVLVIAAFCCDILMTLMYVSNAFSNLDLSIEARFWLECGIVLIRDCRVILLPFTVFLLPDIRQRIKTWRPWYRPRPGSDLAVTYRKDIQ